MWCRLKACATLALAVSGSAGSVRAQAVINVYPADAAVTQLFERLRAPHCAALEAPVATAADRIGRRFRSESPFDALTSELLRDHSGTDIAFLPGVGYGVALEPRVMTREDLSALLPHPTEVATVVPTFNSDAAVPLRMTAQSSAWLE